MLFKFSFFLFAALVSAAPQDFDNSIQNETSKITVVVKNSLLHMEPSSVQFDINDDLETAMKNFLNNTMENYTNWLVQKDPLTPDPAQVTLTSSLLNNEDLADLDAVLIISNQYMANHSKSGRTQISANSQEPIRRFSVGRWVYDGEDAIFGGNYNVTGSMNVSATQNIPFSGQGKYTLKSNALTEYLTTNYIVDENGYANLAKNVYSYLYSIMEFNNIEFEGLKFDYNETIDDKWMPKLKEQLAELYNSFLKHPAVFQQFAEHNPPKRLLLEYLQEKFMSAKLDDLIGIEPTTTPKATTTPKVTTPGSSSATKIFGSTLVCILTLGTVFLHV